MRKLAVLTLCVIVAGVIFAGQSTVSADSQGTQWWQTPDAAEVTIELNDERNANGLDSLPADGVLSYWAEVHAANMAHAGTIYHQDLGVLMRLSGCSSMAENVGEAGSVSQVHEALVASPGHARNMVGGWRLAGIGAASADGQKFVVEVFCTW